MQVAQKPGSPESLQQLVEIVKNPAGSVAALSSVNVGKEDKARQLKDKKVTGDVIVQQLTFSYNFVYFLILKYFLSTEIGSWVLYSKQRRL